MSYDIRIVDYDEWKNSVENFIATLEEELSYYIDKRQKVENERLSLRQYFLAYYNNKIVETYRKLLTYKDMLELSLKNGKNYVYAIINGEPMLFIIPPNSRDNLEKIIEQQLKAKDSMNFIQVMRDLSVKVDTIYDIMTNKKSP